MLSAELISSVANAQRKAVTGVRAHRVNAENAIRLAKIKCNDFTQDQLLAAARASRSIDLLHPPEALHLLLVASLEKHVLPFIKYAVWRMAYCVVDSFAPVIELLRGRPEHRAAAENTLFVATLRQAFNEWVELRAQECEELLTRHAQAMWSYSSWNMESYLAPSLLTTSPDSMSAASSTSSHAADGTPIHSEEGHVEAGVDSATKPAHHHGLLSEVGGRLTGAMQTNSTLDISSTDVPAKLKEAIDKQFEAHKVLLAIGIKHIITAELMHAADSRKDKYDSRKKRLAVFLKDRLNQIGPDPFGLCDAAKRTAQDAERRGRQAASIRELRGELSSLLLELRGHAEDINLYGRTEEEEQSN
jgi:hypothetical protein